MADPLVTRLVEIIDKAAEDLRRATTVSYGPRVEALDAALEKVCNRVSLVISDLEQRPDGTYGRSRRR